jgi:hypothetical protein
MACNCHINTGHSPLSDLCPDDIEQQIIRAYVQLVFAAENTAGVRTTLVARLCSLEVRLSELPDASVLQDLPPFWLEIYSHITRSTVDSLGCFEFDEAELAMAVELVLKAKQYRELYH